MLRKLNNSLTFQIVKIWTFKSSPKIFHFLDIKLNNFKNNEKIKIKLYFIRISGYPLPNPSEFYPCVCSIESLFHNIVNEKKNNKK